MKISATAERIFSTSLLTLPMSLSILVGFIASPNIPKASASGGCDAHELITINSGRGAEPPSRVRGHRHFTGNHYVKVVWLVYRNNSNIPVGKQYVWWADNDGGFDGDTRDTYYSTSAVCYL